MTPEQRQNIIEDFIQYCKDRLDIDQLPIIQYTNDREWATEKRVLANIILIIGA